MEYDLIEIHYQAEHFREYNQIIELLSSEEGQRLAGMGAFTKLLTMIEV